MIWPVCCGAGLLGAAAMFLPAASVEFGFSGKSYSLVPIRDSLAIAALPLAASLCVVAFAALALLTSLPRMALIIVAIAAAVVGGVRGLDVSAGFTTADTKGAGTVHDGTKRSYGDDLFVALTKLSAEHTGTPARGRSERPGEYVAADVFWGPGWELFVWLMLPLSFLLATRLLWSLLPLWGALPIGAVLAVVFWSFVALMAAGNHGAFD